MDGYHTVVVPSNSPFDPSFYDPSTLSTIDMAAVDALLHLPAPSMPPSTHPSVEPPGPSPYNPLDIDIASQFNLNWAAPSASTSSGFDYHETYQSSVPEGYQASTRRQ